MNYFTKNQFRFFWISSIFVWGTVSCSVMETIKSKIPRPEFSIQNFKIKELNLSEITLDLVSSVKNPYNMSLPYSKLGVDVLVEGKKFSHIETDLGNIQANSTKSLPLEIKFKYSDLMSFYRLQPLKESLELKLEGEMKLPVPSNHQALLGMKEISFPILIHRPLPSLNLDVEISNFHVVIPDLKSIGREAAKSVLGGMIGNSKNEESPSIATSFDLIFKNKNPAPILLSNLKFDMELDGNSFINLSPKEIIHSGNSNLVRVTTQIPIIESGTSLVRSLQRKRANYEIKGFSGIQFPGLEDNLANFNYSKLGNLRWK